MTPDCVLVKNEIDLAGLDSGSGVPGQLGLVKFFPPDVFEEVGVDFARSTGIGIGRVAARRSRLRRPRRGARGRVVPEAAVFENLADGIALMGFDEGDDLHGTAALGAAQRIGLVDAFDEHGPPPEAASSKSGGGGHDRLGDGIARP